MPRCIRLVFTTSIEMMKKFDVITKVIRIQKTKKSLRILKTINLMKFQSTKLKADLSNVFFLF